MADDNCRVKHFCIACWYWRWKEYYLSGDGGELWVLPPSHLSQSRQNKEIEGHNGRDWVAYSIKKDTG